MKLWAVFAVALLSCRASGVSGVDCFQCPCADISDFADGGDKLLCDEKCTRVCGGKCRSVTLPGENARASMRTALSGPALGARGLGCFSVLRPSTARYNAFGHVLGIEKNISGRDVDWVFGDRDGQAHVDEFARFYAAHGFRQAQDCQHRPGWRKIALFVRNSDDHPTEKVVSHAAISSRMPGWWESKRGPFSVILHHLRLIESHEFGFVERCLEKDESFLFSLPILKTFSPSIRRFVHRGSSPVLDPAPVLERGDAEPSLTPGEGKPEYPYGACVGAECVAPVECTPDFYWLCDMPDDFDFVTDRLQGWSPPEYVQASVESFLGRASLRRLREHSMRSDDWGEERHIKKWFGRAQVPWLIWAMAMGGGAVFDPALELRTGIRVREASATFDPAAGADQVVDLWIDWWLDNKDDPKWWHAAAAASAGDGQ